MRTRNRSRLTQGRLVSKWGLAVRCRVGTVVANSGPAARVSLCLFARRGHHRRPHGSRRARRCDGHRACGWLPRAPCSPKLAGEPARPAAGWHRSSCRDSAPRYPSPFRGVTVPIAKACPALSQWLKPFRPACAELKTVPGGAALQAGCSAGAIRIYAHLDTLRGMLPPRARVVRVQPTPWPSSCGAFFGAVQSSGGNPGTKRHTSVACHGRGCHRRVPFRTRISTSTACALPPERFQNEPLRLPAGGLPRQRLLRGRGHLHTAEAVRRRRKQRASPAPCAGAAASRGQQTHEACAAASRHTRLVLVPAEASRHTRTRPGRGRGASQWRPRPPQH